MNEETMREILEAQISEWSERFAYGDDAGVPFEYSRGYWECMQTARRVLVHYGVGKLRKWVEMNRELLEEFRDEIKPSILEAKGWIGAIRFLEETINRPDGEPVRISFLGGVRE